MFKREGSLLHKVDGPMNFPPNHNFSHSTQLNPVHNPPEQKMLKSQPLDKLTYEPPFF